MLSLLALLTFLFFSFSLAIPVPGTFNTKPTTSTTTTTTTAVNENDLVMIRDTIEGFYETIVDEVLSTHTENLLMQLTHSSAGRRMHLLQSQAMRLSDGPIPGTCVAKLGSNIGRRIHEQNALVFGSIQTVVSETLPAVWPDYPTNGMGRHRMVNQQQQLLEQDDAIDDSSMVAQHEVASALYSLNMAVSHHLLNVYDKFDLENELRQDLADCVEQQQQQHIKQLEQEEDEGIIAYLTGLASRTLQRFVQLNHGCPGAAFLESHMQAVRTDLQTELEARVGDLVTILYNDLYDQAAF
ncbi:hypothetical protein K492DRAFT_177513 [Lichtheimia hyalospora FSU 10163]|nr:hypothetical protein K492DRAFT_177513 [Lichtheimia hyalospora FSU 10163]